MAHLYFHFAKYSFWDELNNYRRGRVDGISSTTGRIETASDYRRWREIVQQTIEQEIGRPLHELEICSLSYLGVSEHDVSE